MELVKLNSIVVLVVLCSGLVNGGKKLIVVLIDGVRWDYIDDPKLKGFQKLISSGVKVPYVVPVFPSLSYPNWQTLVTGLYPENHGFVCNNMFNNATDTVFRMVPEPGSTDPQWWNDAEPIWITAEKSGRRSALYWWAGCEVEIRGGHPTICERQMDFGPPSSETRGDFLERIDDIVEMFKPSKSQTKDRLSLAMMYYGSVDSAGHSSGTKSSQVQDSLKDIDEILEKMQSKLKKAGLDNDVNIIVVSDHGMTDVKSLKFIDLKKFSSKIKYQFDFGGISMIEPEQGMLNKLVHEIIDEKIEGLTVFKKDDIPAKYHIKESSKTSPVVLIAKKGYFIDALPSGTKFTSHHGYDPEEVTDMRTIFIGSGPDFKKKLPSTEPLYMVDIYNIMCNILKISPLPNNGSWDRVQSLLLNTAEHLPQENASVEFHRLSLIFIVATFVSLFHLMNFKVL